MTEAKHEQAVSMLTGLERFVRLVVERELLLPRDGIPTNFSSSPSPSPGPEKSSKMFGLAKPYSGLYNANSFMSNRSSYTGYRRSISDQNEFKENINNSPESTRINNNKDESNPEPVRVNGTDKNVPPQPAPRKISSQNSSDTPHKPLTTSNSTSSEADDAQVFAKPITNEEFQAMIPQHFLHPKSEPPSSVDATGPTVTVTIKRPDAIGDINFPPTPTTVGKVTEVITKSTFTETVVTRVTDNKLVLPLIIEVSAIFLLKILLKIIIVFIACYNYKLYFIVGINEYVLF